MNEFFPLQKTFWQKFEIDLFRINGSAESFFVTLTANELDCQSQ